MYRVWCFKRHSTDCYECYSSEIRFDFPISDYVDLNDEEFKLLVSDYARNGRHLDTFMLYRNLDDDKSTSFTKDYVKQSIERSELYEKALREAEEKRRIAHEKRRLATAKKKKGDIKQEYESRVKELKKLQDELELMKGLLNENDDRPQS